MHLFVLVHVFLQLNGRQHALAAKLIESVLASVVDKVLLLDWYFFAGAGYDQLELLLVIAFVEIDKRRKIIEVPAVLGVKNLIFIVLHDFLFVFGAKLTYFGEEFLALFLLHLVLPILNIQIKNAINVLRTKFRNQLTLPVLGYVGDVTLFAAE